MSQSPLWAAELSLVVSSAPDRASVMLQKAFYCIIAKGKFRRDTEDASFFGRSEFSDHSSRPVHFPSRIHVASSSLPRVSFLSLSNIKECCLHGMKARKRNSKGVGKQSFFPFPLQRYSSSGASGASLCHGGLPCIKHESVASAFLFTQFSRSWIIFKTFFSSDTALPAGTNPPHNRLAH